MSDPLSAWRPLLDLSKDQLLDRLGVDQAAVQHGLSYGPSTGLDMVVAPQASAVLVYLQGQSVVLVQLSGPVTEALDPDELARHYTVQAAVASQAGKTFEHQIAASQGVAWSDDTRHVAIVEIFSPTTVQDYQARYHQDPGAFIK